MSEQHNCLLPKPSFEETRAEQVIRTLEQLHMVALASLHLSGWYGSSI